MIRKSGAHFCDKIMLKVMIWRMFLSIRRLHLIGTCAKEQFFVIDFFPTVGYMPVSVPSAD
jgi:hypothetical protein